LLCALLHEIGHANDVNFIINNIDMSNLELINNKQWIEIISNHSKVERYAHAYMLNKLRQYQDLPVIDEYIKSCKQVINYTLMIYKY
jgi:predicted HD phosphohydrolase